MKRVTRMVLAMAFLVLPLGGWAGPTTNLDQGHDTNGARSDERRPVSYMAAGGWAVLELPNDEWAINHKETREGTVEWFSHDLSARIGMRAEKVTAGSSVRASVTRLARELEKAGGGEWSTPADYNVAGIPTTRVTGHGVAGNYYFEIYGWQRYGIQYLAYLRTPYENRWNREMNEDLAYVITHSHPSTAAVLQSLKKR